MPDLDTLVRRILAKSERTEDGCLEFMGAHVPKGYGRIGWIEDGEKRWEYTHRVIWVAAHGPLAFGQQVLHYCDNPPCGDLDHLFSGSPKQNSEDMVAKGRWSGRPDIVLGHRRKVAGTLLALVAAEVPGDDEVTADEVSGWSRNEVEQVIEWAAAIHSSASDNAVTVPNLPEILVARLGREGSDG